MLKITEPKKVLCIHDLSGVGRCSLAVILPVLSVMGIQPVALPTVMLSTHTGGFGAPARLDGCAYGEAALEHYREPVSYTHLDVYKRQGLPQHTIPVCLLCLLPCAYAGACTGAEFREPIDIARSP